MDDFTFSFCDLSSSDSLTHWRIEYIGKKDLLLCAHIAIWKFNLVIWQTTGKNSIKMRPARAAQNRHEDKRKT